MKLYVSPRAPNPRRVQMFIAEKGITGIQEVVVEIGKDEHRSSNYRAKSPLAKVPVLELDDGRYLGETRAICSYLEGLYPEPNLMGETFEERAFIEKRAAELGVASHVTIDGGPAIWGGFVKPFVWAGEGYQGQYPLLVSDRYLIVDAALQRCAELAQSGDAVLLSPACASLDMFKNFEERGRLFAQAAEGLQ